LFVLSCLPLNWHYSARQLVSHWLFLATFTLRVL
jgi:hypothetical protein